MVIVMINMILFLSLKFGVVKYEHQILSETMAHSACHINPRDVKDPEM